MLNVYINVDSGTHLVVRIDGVTLVDRTYKTKKQAQQRVEDLCVAIINAIHNTVVDTIGGTDP